MLRAVVISRGPLGVMSTPVVAVDDPPDRCRHRHECRRPDADTAYRRETIILNVNTPKLQCNG